MRKMKIIKESKVLLAAGMLTLATILSGLGLLSSVVEATSTSANASVNVAEACTMTSNVDNAHSATIPPNTYQADIGITTIKITCNDASGHALYAVGYTGDEIGGENSTKLVSVNGGSTNAIATGTATSGSTSNWAMRINTSGSSFIGTIDNSFNNYHAVPNEYTKVAHFNSATDQNTGSTYQTTYAAYVSGTQVAGNYTGKVKYTMVHPANEFVPHEIACNGWKICYNPNTALVEGQMGEQAGYDNYSTTLLASNYKRDGYGFAGWSDKYDYETNEDADFYGPNQTITTPNDVSSKGLSLYAVWIKSAGLLQNWDGCNSLAQGATTALTDERDGNTYAVAKLADDKCWMIENLRLSDGPILSSENTHNPSLPFNNSWYYNELQSTLSTSNQLSSTTDPTQIAWCQSGSASCIDQSMVATNNTTLFIDNTASAYSAEGNVYSYGNYYNWYSATAGHGKYMSYSFGTHVPGDICPIGWRLPTGYSTNQDRGEINVLNNIINNGSTAVSNGLRSFPANFLFSGDIEGSSVSYRRTYGYYWTSTVEDSRFSAKVLSFSSGIVHPADIGTSGVESRYRGYPIRCLSSI